MNHIKAAARKQKPAETAATAAAGGAAAAIAAGSATVQFRNQVLPSSLHRREQQLFQQICTRQQRQTV